MKKRKVLSAFLAALCIMMTLVPFTLGTSAESERSVYATTSTTVAQGSYGYLYVYLDDLTDLSALSVSVYYETDEITVKSAYNRVSATVYDINTPLGCVNASYIFDGNGGATKTNLFYIYYQVNSTAEAGNTYFDIVVSDAYDSSLQPLSVGGSRCSFTIGEAASAKTCNVYSSSSVATSVGQEFELSYRLSTYKIASGSFSVSYDPELFEVVGVTNGAFCDNKILDVNTELSGTVYFSFVGTEYNSNTDLVSVRFKTRKNTAVSSTVKMTVTELYDLELAPISCSGYTTTANIAFDESYTEDAPSMSISTFYDAQSGKVIASVKLEENSHLGAGDFVLSFDAECLCYISAEKGFSPTFFNINDKNTADGILKFSVISLSDITEAQSVLTVVFEAKRSCTDCSTELDISGAGLVDSLTNNIKLNFLSSSAEISAQGHQYGEWSTTAPTPESAGFRSKVCSACGDEVLEMLVYGSGDVDGDGALTNSDITLAIRTMSGWNTDACMAVADLNYDGKINNRDIIALIRKLAGWN